MRRRRSLELESRWRDRLARFRESRLTVAEFCRREGVSAASFYHWKKRLGERTSSAEEGRKPADAEPGRASRAPFVPVRVPSPPMAEVDLPNGLRIRIPAGDGEALRAALRIACEVYAEGRRC